MSSRYTLLSEDNPKILKMQAEHGVYALILHLAPAQSAGVEINGVIIDVCGGRSEGCTFGCLNKSGMGAVFPSIQEARIRKTRWLYSDKPAFLEALRADIRKAQLHASKLGLRLAVRINGTSDLPWLAMAMASEFETVQFYDYTKLPKAWQRTRANYHLTFSLHESNLPMALEAMEHGLNVAVVFDTRKGQPLPEFWHGRPVIDGDLHDMRFLDPAGVVVGLRAKGPAKSDKWGFVQLAKLAAAEVL